MQIAELLKEDSVTLKQLAAGLGVSGIRAIQRYRDGDRIPDRDRMRALVIFSEGRVTPNDVYGLTDLIEQCLARRSRRLARRKAAAGQEELPLPEPAAAEAEQLALFEAPPSEPPEIELPLPFEDAA